MCVPFVCHLCTIYVPFACHLHTICVPFVYHMCTICVPFVYHLCNMCTICVPYVCHLCAISAAGEFQTLQLQWQLHLLQSVCWFISLHNVHRTDITKFAVACCVHCIVTLLWKYSTAVSGTLYTCWEMNHASMYSTIWDTVIPRLTKIIRSGITFFSRNVISRRFL